MHVFKKHQNTLINLSNFKELIIFQVPYSNLYFEVIFSVNKKHSLL